jgi:hypothetical protein
MVVVEVSSIQQLFVVDFQKTHLDVSTVNLTQILPGSSTGLSKICLLDGGGGGWDGG